MAKALPTSIVDDMASHLELLEGHLAVLWEEQNIPAFIAHVERRLSTTAALHQAVPRRAEDSNEGTVEITETKRVSGSCPKDC